MSPEEQVRSALSALAEHDRSLESSTPASAIFSQRRVSKRPQARWIWLGAVAAAAAFVFAMEQWPEPKPPEIIVIEHPRRPVETPKVTEPQVETTPKPVRRVKRVAKRAPALPQEIATEFFPLMDSPPPFERGQLVRVVVPAVTMRDAGLPVPPERWNDRVQADVLVGEEGMARAIRFVSFRQ
jgi:hypothetical protein